MFELRDPIRHTVPVRLLRLFQDSLRVVGDQSVREQQDFIEKRLQFPVVMVFLR